MHMQQLTVGDEAMERLREVFVGLEGACESWTDEEVVTRVLIRGAMDYARSGGAEWADVQALAATLRRSVSAG
jgi:hypothetical protein